MQLMLLQTRIATESVIQFRVVTKEKTEITLLRADVATTSHVQTASTSSTLVQTTCFGMTLFGVASSLHPPALMVSNFL